MSARSLWYRHTGFPWRALGAGWGMLDARYTRSFFSLFSHSSGLRSWDFLSTSDDEGLSRLRILVYGGRNRLLREELKLGGRKWSAHLGMCLEGKETVFLSFLRYIIYEQYWLLGSGSIRCSSHHGPFSTCWRKSLFVFCTRFMETRGSFCSRELCGWVYARGWGLSVGRVLGTVGAWVYGSHSFGT